jgi:hypothetical protein
MLLDSSRIIKQAINIHIQKNEEKAQHFKGKIQLAKKVYLSAKVSPIEIANENYRLVSSSLTAAASGVVAKNI